MKLSKKLILILFLYSAAILGNERRVLVEIFTNSHCPLCTASYSAIDNFLQTPDGDNIEFIFYHMTFPYSDDPLYQHNGPDSDAKNTFYGPYSSTPRAHFDGILVSNSYNNWGIALSDLLNEASPFKIELSAEINDGSIVINAAITQDGEISGDLSTTINFVIIEDIIYSGRNGISDHKNVMRDIVNPQGEPFEISLNETKNLSASVDLNDDWDLEKIKVIAFVQDMNTKDVYQSGSLASSEFVITNADIKNTYSDKFSLSQNYPNPFNPSTTINYTIPGNIDGNSTTALDVKLTVYDILGEEIATIVDNEQNPGNYSVTFNASDLSSGFYYYQLRAGELIKTRKMIFLK